MLIQLIVFMGGVRKALYVRKRKRIKKKKYYIEIATQLPRKHDQQVQHEDDQHDQLSAMI